VGYIQPVFDDTDPKVKLAHSKLDKRDPIPGETLRNIKQLGAKYEIYKRIYTRLVNA